MLTAAYFVFYFCFVSGIAIIVLGIVGVFFADTDSLKGDALTCRRTGYALFFFGMFAIFALNLAVRAAS